MIRTLPKLEKLLESSTPDILVNVTLILVVTDFILLKLKNVVAMLKNIGFLIIDEQSLFF